MAKKLYTGSILFLVHPGILYYNKETLEYEGLQIKAARKKIESAIRKAALRRIPVVYEIFQLVPGQRPVRRGEQKFLSFVDSLKPKPRLVESNFLAKKTSERERTQTLKKQLLGVGIHPTRVALMGLYRELCVTSAASNLARAFPKAKIHLIGGSSTVSIKSAVRKATRKLGLPRSPNITVSKKLIPARHFA